MKESNKLGYFPCRYRKSTSFINKNKQLITYGKCLKDGKSCRTTAMFGYDCYELKEEDLID